MRREVRATYGCHNMITSGPILMFQVYIEPYWSTQHDWIFENGATAFLVAKICPKSYIYIWIVWRATELKFRIYSDYPQIYYWHLFWCHCGHLEFLFFCLLSVCNFFLTLEQAPCHFCTKICLILYIYTTRSIKFLL